MEDYVAEAIPSSGRRLVEQLDLNQLGFKGVKPVATGRALTIQQFFSNFQYIAANKLIWNRP